MLLALIAHTTAAEGKADIAALKGETLIISSPFVNGADASRITVSDISFSPDYADDGKLIINGVSYPVDRLFRQNADGRWENLNAILKYNGTGGTFFIRYYDKGRLAVADEKARLEKQTATCMAAYDGDTAGKVLEEVADRQKCLDDVFSRTVNLFYSFNAGEMHESYNAVSSAADKFYTASASPDYCYGRCGTLAAVTAADKALSAKRDFILHLLKNIEF